MYEVHNLEYTYATRQAASNQIKPKGTPRLDISLKTYRWRAAVYYNKLPTYITQIEDKGKFKGQLKNWVKSNVPFKL